MLGQSILLEFARWDDQGDHDELMGANQVQMRWGYRVRSIVYLICNWNNQDIKTNNIN